MSAECGSSLQAKACSEPRLGQLSRILPAILIVAATIWGVYRRDEDLQTLRHQQRMWNLFDAEVRKRWEFVFSPDADRLTFLPPDAVVMIRLLEKHQSTSYWLSQGIIEQNVTFQRLIEGALPRKPTWGAPHYLYLSHEVPPAGCTPVDSSGGIQLARCR